MSNETALKAFNQLLNDINPENHLFIGTINPEMIKVAISAIEDKIASESENKTE